MIFQVHFYALKPTVSRWVIQQLRSILKLNYWIAYDSNLEIYLNEVTKILKLNHFKDE